MRRREFVAFIGGVAAVWPLGARAQKRAGPWRLGVLMSNAESDPLGQERIAALRAGLRELGWSEGGSLRIDVRWAGSDGSRLTEYAAELVGLVPDVRHARHQSHGAGDALHPHHLCGSQRSR
jgi:putative ABC transport system substrate-binding protein